MNVRNCRICGRIFNYVTGVPICPACKEEREAKFQEVKQFVYDNKGAGIHEIAEHCHVETSQIRQWIREERLTFADDSPVGINCEICGAMIKTGRFCEKCKKEMATQLGSVTKKNEPVKQVKKNPHDDPKMRFLDRT